MYGISKKIRRLGRTRVKHPLKIFKNVKILIWKYNLNKITMIKARFRQKVIS
jgi:hypothetical protein